MASVVGICNRALALIGEEPITALTDESEAARRCDLLYADTRDAVLRAHPWNAAVARAELAALSSAPAFGYAYQHSLPSDCLRLLRLKADDRRVVFKVEAGRRVLSDTTPLQVLYVKRIDDPNEFDILLVDAIAARLAHDLAYAIAGSASLAGQMWELYQRKLVEARKADGQEGSPDKLEADEWLDARF